MAFYRILSFVLVSVLSYSHCSYVETLNKCALRDKDCLKNLIQKVLKDIAKHGIPELDMPPIDPVELKHINASILNVIDLELHDGVATGVKDCVVESTDVNVEHLRVSIKLTCNIIVKGKYVVKSSTPVLNNLLGGNIHGKGDGMVKIEKITITIEFPFHIKKRGEDTFFTSKLKNYKYTFNIHGKVTFYANNLYLGDKESSKEIVKLLNENWKTIIDSFGGHFFSIAIKYVYEFIIKFFGNVATKHYLTDDIAALA